MQQAKGAEKAARSLTDEEALDFDKSQGDYLDALSKRAQLAKGLDSRDYLRHTCLRRLAAVLVAMVPEEKESSVLRNLVPGLRLFLGTEATRQLFLENYQGENREELLSSTGDEG